MTAVYELPSGALVDTTEAADAAAEAVRALNHLTPHGLDNPGDVYVVLGALATMVHRLPQACVQLANFLHAEATDGRVADYALTPAGDPHAAVCAASRQLGVAVGLAQQLAVAIDKAQQACAGLAAVDE